MSDSDSLFAVFALLSIGTLLTFGMILFSGFNGALESAQSGNAAVITDWIIVGVTVIIAVMIIGVINSAR